MLRTSSRILQIICIGLFFTLTVTKAQEKKGDTIYLSTYIQDLETIFNVKFSYVDADIKALQITTAKFELLDDIIKNIKSQTNLNFKKLNNRYYTISKNSSLDICGVVLDNFGQNTVTGATIEILDTNMSIITNEFGSFSFKNIPINATIQIKHLGFKTRYIDAKQLTSLTQCKTIFLTQYYHELEEVILYDFLTKGLVKKLDASIEISTEKFGILPGLIEPDVLQTVQAIPGIKSIDETVSDINIRGGSNDQNLILWDGIKMYQSGHFFGLISAFNPYLTKKVQLIKNGTSAQYGEGVSGIIDMQTNNRLTETFIGGAGFNLISGDLYGQVPLGEKLGFQFSGRRSSTDFLNTSTFDKLFAKAFLNNQVKDGIPQVNTVERDDQFYFYDITAKLLYDLNAKQKLRISFININNYLDYTERVVNLNRETISDLNQTNYSLGINLKSNWTKKFSSFFSSYYSNYSLDATNTSALGQQIFYQGNKVIEKGVKINTDFRLNESFNWLNGYQLSETSITNETTVTQPLFGSKTKDLIKVHSFFSELSYNSPDQKVFAKGGMRINIYDNPNTFSEILAEPRLNFSYAFIPKLKAFVLGELKSQGVNQVLDLEQNFLGIEKRRWILSDGDALPITKSKQIAIGLNYEENNLHIGLEGFYKEVKGISTTTQGFQNQNQFHGEVGQYDIKGIEFLINKKTSKYSIWASYVYNLNNYTFNTIAPPTFPNNLDIRHTATLGVILTFNKLKIGAGINYHSGKPFTIPDPDNPLDTSIFPALINYNDANSERLAAYLRVDASVIYSFHITPKIKADTGISILNLTNRSNILNTYFQVNDSNNVETIESFSLGFMPNFSFRIKF